MRTLVIVLILLTTAPCYSQGYDRGRPSDAYDVPDEILEMSDAEYARYEKKHREDSERKQWIVFIALIVGVIAYSILKERKSS